MRLPAWQHFAFGPVHRVIAVFVVLVLLPGVVLGVFALRTLRQEKLLAQQQIQQRLESIAARTGRDLALEFRQCQEALPSVAEGKATNPSALPEMIRLAIAGPGSGVVVLLDGQNFKAYPPGQLLYLPSTVPVSSISLKVLPPSVTRIETVEFVQKDYPRAIRQYQELLDSGGAELRPVVLHRLARTFRKAGRLDDAVRSYLELEGATLADTDRLPSNLVARFELCSIAAERGTPDELAARVSAFYRDLTGGRWLLEKPRYFYYSDRCRTWSKEIPVAAGDFKQLEAVEGKKLALTDAVEQLLTEPGGCLHGGTSRYLAFWQRNPFAAIVLSGDFLSLHWWPRVISLAEDQDLAAALCSADGTVALGTTPERAESLAAVHNIRVGDEQWNVHIWPRHPAVLYADLKQRQDLYMGMMIFVVALLVFGSYITARTVRREFEIARMRAEFVSTVSHEFRSPLTGIRQLGEMLLDGRVHGDEKQRRYFRMIVQESERLGRLVENILDFSRMEEGRKEYRFAPLDTSIWLRGVVSDFQFEVAGNEVSVAASIPEGLPRITADGEAMACAVHNLLDNAVKYSPGSKTVWLEAHAENGTVRISVRDQGVGIPAPDLKHIFDKFYRVDAEISHKVKGAGLGLSLVKHIVTAHDGTVDCESRMGEGSTFSIRLPAAPPAGGGRRENAAHSGG